MELVALLRLLWRLRIVVAVGAVVAAGVGFMAMNRASASSFGVASVRAVIDTPQSQTVDVNPPGVSTLEWRAALAADLVATAPARERLAKAMQVDVADLVVSAPYRAVPPVPAPLPTAALEAAAGGPQRYHVAIQGISKLPLVQIDVSAPNRDAAKRLASAAADELENQFATDSDSARGTADFLVSPVGPVWSREVVNRPSRLIAVAVAMMVFLLWCAAVAVIGGLSPVGRSTWRATAYASR